MAFEIKIDVLDALWRERAIPSEVLRSLHENDEFLSTLADMAYEAEVRNYQPSRAFRDVVDPPTYDIIPEPVEPAKKRAAEILPQLPPDYRCYAVMDAITCAIVKADEAWRKLNLADAVAREIRGME